LLADRVTTARAIRQSLAALALAALALAALAPEQKPSNMTS
jgi:hypothetical protein